MRQLVLLRGLHVSVGVDVGVVLDLRALCTRLLPHLKAFLSLRPPAYLLDTFQISAPTLLSL